MIYYEMIVFFMVVLTGIPIILGFFLKNKFKRYLCWLLSLPLLAMTISTINKHSSDLDKERIKYVGYYKIDIQKSIYKEGNLIDYKDLILHVNEDKTFNFSENSFFQAQTGTWNFVPNEDIGFVNCRFPDKNITSLVFAGNGYWGFQHDCIRNGRVADIIYFKKIGSE